MIRFSNTDEFIIRDQKGHTYGPFSYERLKKLITKGVMDGTEKIAVYPDGHFVDISTVPQFYDRLLAILADGDNEISEQERHTEFTRYQSKVYEESDIKHEHRERGIAIKEKSLKTTPSVKESKTESSRLPDRVEKSLSPHRNDDTEVFYQDPDIKDHRGKKFFKLVIFIGLVFILFVLLFSDLIQERTSVNLLSPSKSDEFVSASYQIEQLGKAKKLFEMDTFSGYLRAQKILVEVLGKKVRNDFFLESLSKDKKLDLQAKDDKVYGPFSIDEVRGMIKKPIWDNIVAYSIHPTGDFIRIPMLPSTVRIYAFLCLSHLELWPLSDQTAKDLSTVNRVANEAIKSDSIGWAGQSCRYVRRKLGGQLRGLEGFVDSVLKSHPEEANFYLYKAEILMEKKKLKDSLAYVKKAEELWPKWIKPYVLEAHLRLLLNQVDSAQKILSVVVDKVPRHGEAKILLGEIEFLNNPKDGIKRILSGLSVDKLKREVFVKAHTLLADYYMKSGKRKEALESAKQAYRADPLSLEMKNIILKIGGEDEFTKLKSDDKKLIAQGLLYQKGNNFIEAQREFREAYKLNPKNARAAFLAGESLWKLNQVTEAINWLKKAIKVDPQYIDAYLKLAEFYAQRYDFEKAVSALSKAAKKTSGNSYKIHKVFAGLELKRRNYVGAIREAEKALTKYDSDIETFIILARAYHGKGDAQKSFEYAARAVHSDENNIQAQCTYAQMMSHFQGVTAASQYLKRKMSLSPRETAYTQTLARIHMEDDNHTEALNVLKPLLESSSLDKELWIMVGDIYQNLKKPQLALRAYLSAAERDPSDAHPIFQTGRLYMSTQQYNKAIEQFERVIKINSLYPMAHYYLGLAYMDMGNASKALKHAKYEKRYNPHLGSVYILAGKALLKMKRFSKASDEFRKAIKAGERTTEVYILLANCYRELDSYDIALDMLKTAESIENGRAEVHREMGSVYYDMGDKAAASNAYKRYLKLQPNAPDRVHIESRILSSVTQ